MFNFAELSCFDDAAPHPCERIPFVRSQAPLRQMKAIMFEIFIISFRPMLSFWLATLPTLNNFTFYLLWPLNVQLDLGTALFTTKL